MVVALTALVVAMSGTAIAASQMSGDKLIKKHSLSGNRLRNQTITGTQVNLNKLGKVPSAKNADHATTASSAITAATATAAVTAGSATNATNAANATNATNATTAANLTGLMRWRMTVATPGASSSAPHTATLATVGPFTITGECYINGTNTEAGTFIASSQAGAAAQGYSGEGSVPLGPSDGAVQISDGLVDGATASHTENFDGPDDGSWAAENADGSVTLNGFGNQGVYMQGASGPACSFSGFLITE